MILTCHIGGQTKNGIIWRTLSFGLILPFFLPLCSRKLATSFLSDTGKPVVRSMGRYADLTDVTLADEDTNSIITDNANRAIQGNVAMQATQPGDQLCKQCKWRHLMTKL